MIGKRIPSFFGGLALILASVPAGASDAEFRQDILKLHNDERVKVGSTQLTWSSQLEADALAWAEMMADEGERRHSTKQQRGETGESIWIGEAGLYSLDVIFSTFMAEKDKYRPGTFPDVSTTGSWRDVGHYTQVIWPGTTEIGCAFITRNGFDVLVCRYSPPGNTIGVAME